MTDSLTIANTIRHQLGARRFDMMTGAKNFLALESGLQLDLPARFAKLGINRVRVVLTPADDYTVTFFKIARRGMDVAVKAEFSGIYADQLQRIFTATTGLDTHL